MQGLDLNRRLTLKDLVTRLRLKLSEPQPGTWGTVHYHFGDEDVEELTVSDVDEIFPDENPIQTVNELALILNESQDLVCRDLYDRDYAFFETEIRIPTAINTDTYILPGDFMAEESVFHFRGKDFCELEEATLRELKKLDAYGSYSYGYNNFYSNYEIRGNAGTVIYQDQICRNSEDTIYADDHDDDEPPFDPEKINYGDLVNNLSDGSVARVEGATNNSIKIDYLVNGKINKFLIGDVYQVVTASQPFEVLNVWPRIRTLKEDNVYSGDPNTVSVDFTRDVTRIRFNVVDLPSNVNMKRSRAYVGIQDGDGNRAATGVIFEPLEKQWNTAVIMGELEVDTEYYTEVVMRNEAPEEVYEEGDTIPEGSSVGDLKPVDEFIDTEIEINRVEIYENTGNNHLDLAYTRLPTPMTHADYVCEFPPYIMPALIAYAKVVAYQKKTGMPQVDENMYSEYNDQVSRIETFLRKRGPSGNKNMFTNPHTTTGRSVNNRWIAAGWTNEIYF